MPTIKERLEMPPEIIECEQQSDEWFAARLGRVTASHFSDVFLSRKSGRKTYMMRLLAERVTHVRMESYSNVAMEQGIETEPEARNYYESVKEITVEQVGFVLRDEDIGASPDGLIGDDGILEIKCPYPQTHLEYILVGKLPSAYKAQIQGQLWVTDRQWLDFVSYNPLVLYPPRPFWCIRVVRDERYISELASAVEQFIYELKTLEEKVKNPF